MARKNKKWRSQYAKAYYERNRDLMLERAKSHGEQKYKSVPGRAGVLLNTSRQRARKLGLPFDLTASAIEELLRPMVCALTGVRLSLETMSGAHNPRAPSLDRIDASGGYTLNNVRIVCWQVNAALNSFGEAAFAEIARAYVGRTG